MYNTLIEPKDLFSQLQNPNWVVVDCRFSLLETEQGRQDYQQGHIPGAVYAHLDEDLADPVTVTSGRHPLPDPARFAATLGHWGIGESTQVVAYDSAGGAIAGRLWWLLRWLGHRSCAVLNGGLPAWERQGYPLSSETAEPIPTSFPLTHADTLSWVDSAYMLANSHGGVSLVIDARAAARYRGEMEPIDPVAGHVPGAVNLPMDENLDEQGCFLPAEALRTRFAAALGARPPDWVVHMCGSGVTACHNLLAMEIAGLTGSRLYVGSWSEWIRDSARPVVTGTE